MPTVTLLRPRTYTVLGKTFQRGEPTLVAADLARQLQGNEHFSVDMTAGPAAESSAVNCTDETAAEAVADPAPEPLSAIETIQDAASSLNIDDEANFDPDGKPAVAALSQALGREVTVEERDRALTVSSAPAEQEGGRRRIVRRAGGKPDPSTEGAVDV
jgi:hypothetical protein